MEVEPAALAASCLVSAFSRDERPAWFSAAAQLKLDAMQDRYRVPGAPATLCVLGELETFLCPTDSPACRRFASNVRLSTSQPASTLYVFARVRNTLPAWLTISLVLFPRPPVALSHGQIFYYVHAMMLNTHRLSYANELLALTGHDVSTKIRRLFYRSPPPDLTLSALVHLQLLPQLGYLEPVHDHHRHQRRQW